MCEGAIVQRREQACCVVHEVEVRGDDARRAAGEAVAVEVKSCVVESELV
jgi:hypothetical protein